MTTDASGGDSDLEKIAQDLQALKKDFAQLLEHVKSGATDSVSEEATRFYNDVASEGHRRAAALAQTVEEKPLTSVLIAFAVGFVTGKILLR